ncbi:MAG: OmpH family outer membrane protein [Candidatus Glassbacteria bacterium]|nr:OmpH family outer membrane protein [Candidatus Glassbacteria bacterium]
MRHILVFCLVIIISPVLAQQPKFGFVEDKLILEKLSAVKEVQRILDQETAIWEKDFNARQSQLRVYLDSVKAVETALAAARQAAESAGAEPAAAQKPQPVERDSSSVPADSASAADSTAVKPAAVDTVFLLSQMERLEARLEREKKETVALYHKIYGKDGILERRNAELSQSILERVHQAVVETSEREGMEMIFDSGILLYIDQELNLTDQVMEALGIGEQRLR